MNDSVNYNYICKFFKKDV